jgi:hypothetical protein
MLSSYFSFSIANRTTTLVCLQLYTLISHVDVKDFKGLQNETVEA